MGATTSHWPYAKSHHQESGMFSHSSLLVLPSCGILQKRKSQFEEMIKWVQ
jgi:hypothetical protein